VPDNALVDEMKLGVRARANDATRIEDLIARSEERCLWARLDDDACRIVADHFCGAGRRRGAGAHLIVYWIHGNGADLDQKTAPRGGWAGQLDVYKTIGRRNGAWSEISDCAHGCVLSGSLRSRYNALCIASFRFFMLTGGYPVAGQSAGYLHHQAGGYDRAGVLVAEAAKYPPRHVGLNHPHTVSQ
jgi:hypothetical protein